MSFSIIAAVGKNRELGKDGKLVFHLPSDLAFFKKTTLGHPVLMGFNTFKSLPKVLPGRKNYVLTRSVDFEVPEGVEIVSDLNKFIDDFKDSDEEVFVIGGGMVYVQMLEHADKLYLTEVDAEADADTFFPEFDKTKYNRVELGTGEDNGLKFTFIRYDKIK
ncbi:dihydrofolate reductase [Candidatus Saccharibacteria bacterium]|nr:dihydrofolate reductase [Candidatus Saccharibacteria bacterium]